MKIIFFLSNLNLGGVQSTVLSLSKEFVNKGIETDVYVLNSDTLSFENVHVHKCDNFFKKLFFIFKVIYKNKDNCIFISGQPYLNVICLLSNLFLRGKLFVTEHNPSFKTVSSVDKFIDVIKFPLYFFSDGIFCVSSKVLTEYKSNFFTKDIPSCLVYNSVEFKNLEVSSKIKTDVDPFKILFAGRFESQKNVEMLLYAVAILKNKNLNFVLDIVGSGSLESKYKDLVANLNLTNYVNFYPRQPNISKFLYNSDVFVLPSLYEGFGIVLIEALYANVQVVSTFTEGPSEIITPDTGFLTGFSPDSIADGIIESIRFPKSFESMRARAVFLSSPHLVAERYLKLIKQVN